MKNAPKTDLVRGGLRGDKSREEIILGGIGSGTLSIELNGNH